MPSFRDVFLALRPAQWTKNAVVMAAFFFAFWDRSQSLRFASGLLTAAAAAALFCVASSAIYVLNDIRDADADRLHPVKKHRPIAAGRLSVPHAWLLFVVLLAVGGAGAWCVSPAFAGTVTAYVLIQVLYSHGLKRVALLDTFVIAAGFVLRAMAGAVALKVHISHWLLLCAFLLALFLALCKRRHEKTALSIAAQEGRPSLERYDRVVLDQLISIVSAATVVCYAIYTLSAETVNKFGTAGLGFTIPLVMFGIFRYLDLVYRLDQGGRPEKIVLTDPATLVNLALYGVTVIVVFLVRG
jgi:4-hydroxybenzoate polyprenyltransferase